jgi:WD40 repeat protein
MPNTTPSLDPYAPLEAGLDALLVALGSNHPSYQDALIYEHRLRENLTLARTHGDTRDYESSRAQIVAQLNRLAEESLGRSFPDLGEQTRPSLHHTDSLPCPYHGLFTVREQTTAPFPTMPRENLPQMVIKPAAHLGVTFAEGLVERLLNDGGNDPINLPRLELVLTLLWQHGELTHAGYDEIGGWKGALATAATASERASEKHTHHPARQNVPAQHMVWGAIGALLVLLALLLVTWDGATVERLGAPLAGHQESVLSVAFSPDGQTLASGSQDHTVRLWDVATGQPRGNPLTGHTYHVNSVAFSPDGQTLASGGCSKTDEERSWHCLQGEIWLWDVATGKPRGEPFTGHAGSIFSVAFSPDGQTLLSGSGDGTFRLWDVATGKPRGEPFTGHAGSIFSVAFSPDGQTLLSGSGDGTFRQWDVATGQPLGAFLGGQPDHASSVAFSPDGKMVAFGYCASYHEVYCTEGGVSLWDVATGQPRGNPLTGHTNSVWSLAFSPDGKTLVSVACGKGGEMYCHEGEMILWDMETMLPIGDPLRGHTSYVNSVAFSPDGQTVATGSSDQTVMLWRVSVEP